MLVSSHVLSEVEQTVDRVVVLAAGRVAYDGELAGLAGPAGVLVDAPDRAGAGRRARRPGLACADATGALLVPRPRLPADGVDPAQVGAAAAAAGVALSHLAPTASGWRRRSCAWCRGPSTRRRRPPGCRPCPQPRRAPPRPGVPHEPGRARRAGQADDDWAWWGLLLIALALVLLNVGLVAALAPVDPAAAEGFPFPLVTTTEGQLALVGGGLPGRVPDGGGGRDAPGHLGRPQRHHRADLPRRPPPRAGRRGQASSPAASSGSATASRCRWPRSPWPSSCSRCGAWTWCPADDLARPLLLGVLGTAVWALIGLGFGLLVRHQVVALVTVLVVVFLLDPLVVLLSGVGEVGGSTSRRWAPTC